MNDPTHNKVTLAHIIMFHLNSFGQVLPNCLNFINVIHDRRANPVCFRVSFTTLFACAILGR